MRFLTILTVLLSSFMIYAENDMIAFIESQQNALFKKISPAVVLIVNKESLGSGFFISQNGLILTNAHVVKKDVDMVKPHTVSVVLQDGRKYNGEVIEIARNNLDLALVKISENGMPFLDISKEPTVQVGSWAGAVGHGEGGIWTYNTGMISNSYWDDQGHMYYQTQIPLNPGNSGGPVFDKNGAIIGIVTAYLKEANSINFAISITMAADYLDNISFLSKNLVIRLPKNIPVFVNGIMKGKGPQISINVPEGTYEIFAVINGVMVKKSVEFPKTRIVELK